MKIEKNQVLDEQNALIDENKKLLNLVETTLFETERRLGHFGFINSLSSIKECVEAMAYLNSKVKMTSEALEELGLDSIPENENTFLGYPIRTWKNDIKKRKVQINALLKIELNENAIKLLEKHLSPEDLFNRDMEKLDKMLNDREDMFTKIVNSNDENCEQECEE